MIETLVIIFMVCVAISSIIFVIQLLRKRPSNKLWGIVALFFIIALLISGLFLPDGPLSDSDKTTAKGQETKVENAGFAEIYTSFQENELVAKEKYNGKKYRIQAKINGMETGGLFNLTGGATLTMENQVGNTVVFFYAEFEEREEEKLKSVKVGDDIVFIGECQDGNFVDCELQ